MDDPRINLFGYFTEFAKLYGTIVNEFNCYRYNNAMKLDAIEQARLINISKHLEQLGTLYANQLREIFEEYNRKEE